MDAIGRRLGLSGGPLIAVAIALLLAFIPSLQVGLHIKRMWAEPGQWVGPEVVVVPLVCLGLLVGAIGWLIALRFRAVGLMVLALGLGSLAGIGAGLALGQGYRAPIHGTTTVVLDEPSLSFTASLECVWEGDAITDLNGTSYSEELGRGFWMGVGLEPGEGGQVPYALQLGLVADDSTGAPRSQYEWWPSGGAPAPDAIEIGRDGRTGSFRFAGLEVADPGPPDWPASLSGIVSWSCGS